MTCPSWEEHVPIENVSNLLKHCGACIMEAGQHFQHLLLISYFDIEMRHFLLFYIFLCFFGWVPKFTLKTLCILFIESVKYENV